MQTEINRSSNYYVAENSIVRKIWGTADTILLIFGGAAAEFALNKSVDWLYYTGRLPADPLGRLFTTVDYAREIIFSSTDEANTAIDRINSIHSHLENARGFEIPDSAYRDVLFMLIHYSISSFEVLERKLTAEEKEDVVEVFLRVGHRMNIPDLPSDYLSWQKMYERHQLQDLRRSEFTVDLFRQYRKHLGPVRYFILKESQKLVASKRVRRLLHYNDPLLIRPVIATYRLSRVVGVDKLLKAMLLPPAYKQRISMLDRHQQ